MWFLDCLIKSELMILLGGVMSVVILYGFYIECSICFLKSGFLYLDFLYLQEGVGKDEKPLQYYKYFMF